MDGSSDDGDLFRGEGLGVAQDKWSAFGKYASSKTLSGLGALIKRHKVV